MNNKAPTTNIVLYSIDPKVTSPIATDTIYPVIVCIDSKGFNVIWGLAPAAIATIIVSPIALDIAKINDETIPEIDAGNTIFFITSNLVAPIP